MKMNTPNIRKVLIGTPAHDGRVDVWYTNSLVNTVRLSYEKGIYIHAIYTSYDSLIQRARNSLVKLALDQGFDDLFFIDGDVEWEPEWVFRLLERPEPIIGAALIKKSEKEGYTVKLTSQNLAYNDDKTLLEVPGVGTGFLKVSRFALERLWQDAPPYTSEGEEHRMIFDVVVRDGQLISEDYILCEKWQNMGYKVWIDPTITCNHLGTKKYKGNLQQFLRSTGYV